MVFNGRNKIHQTLGSYPLYDFVSMSLFQVILSLGLAGPFLSLAAVRRTGKKILLLVSTAAMTAAALFLALLSHFEVSGAQ